MHYKKNPLTLALSLAALSFTGVTVAQDDLSFAIEEIVVTAQKRAQSVQDIGIAVSAFAGDDIRDLSMSQPVDLAAQTPGLVSANLMGETLPSFTIRGVGLNDYSASNSGVVGLYVDEVYMSSPVFSRFQMMDVERVEVLKGPQGTLYGRNTSGGAVNFVSTRPSEEFEAYVTADYELEYGKTKVEGAVNGALSDTVNARVSLSSTQGGEWQKDFYTGKEYGDQDVFSIRALFDVELSEDASVLLNVHGGYDKSVGMVWQNTTGGTWGLGGDVPGTEFGKGVTQDVTASVVPEMDNDTWGASATFSVDFEGMSFTSITAYDEFNRDQLDANDGSQFRLVEWYFPDEQYTQLSQEFRLTSEPGELVDWIVGANWAREEVSIKGSYADVTDIQNLFDSFLLGTTLDLVGVDTNLEQESEVLGAYAHTQWHMSDTLDLIVGLRYSYEDRELDTEVGLLLDNDFTLDGNIDLVRTVLGGPVKNNRDEEDISGKVGLEWSPNEDWLIYGSISKGFKSHTALGAASLDLRSYDFVDPEELWATEIGFKGTLLDGTLRVNGAIYSYDYKKVQSLGTDNVAQADWFYNIDEATVEGGEFDLWWRPVAGLDVRLGAAYTNTHIDKVGFDSSTISQAWQPGDELVFAPEWSGNGVISYTTSLGNGMEVRAATDFSYRESYVPLVGDEALRVPNAFEYGARLTLASEDGAWDVALWGKNLGNEVVPVNAYNSFSGDGTAVFLTNMPRTYGVSVKYNWM